MMTRISNKISKVPYKDFPLYNVVNNRFQYDSV